MADRLSSFAPKPGDSILLPAGTVHSLGGLVVFEAQQNSDVTFRLYDWNHVDAKTGRHRPLQIDQALACVDFAQGELRPGAPVIEGPASAPRERLFSCEHFRLWRLHGGSPFVVGATGVPRVVVCISGKGSVGVRGAVHAIGKGDVALLPAVVGACSCRPLDDILALEIALPEAD